MRLPSSNSPLSPGLLHQLHRSPPAVNKETFDSKIWKSKPCAARLRSWSYDANRNLLLVALNHLAPWMTLEHRHLADNLLRLTWGWQILRPHLPQSLLPPPPV